MRLGGSDGRGRRPSDDGPILRYGRHLAERSAATLIISCVRLFALCVESLGLRVGLIGGRHERERHLAC